jgi:hypothetical protein
VGSLCDLFVLVFINASFTIFFVGCEVRGIFETLHVIPLVFATALYYAMFGVNVYVDVGAVGERSLVVLYLNV